MLLLEEKLQTKINICFENEISICYDSCGNTYCNQYMKDITTCHYCVPIKFKVFIQ